MPPSKSFRVRKEYHAYFESNVFQALEEIAYQERKTVNQKINDLAVKEVESHNIPEPNPLNLSYKDGKEELQQQQYQPKQEPQEPDLRFLLKLSGNDLTDIAKRQRITIDELERLGRTILSVARREKERCLNNVH